VCGGAGDGKKEITMEIFLYFTAIPVGLVAGWCWETWRTRNYTALDWQKMCEKSKKDLNILR
jgi:hypothetical protein